MTRTHLPFFLPAKALMLLAGCLCLSAAPAALAQNGAGPVAATPTVFTPAGASADYRVGAGDVLGIAVYRAPEMSAMTTVETDGAILVPELGRVTVDGRTVAEIARLLADGYGRAHILVNPSITVTVTQLRARRVSVMGAVSRPGEMALDREGMTLSRVLAQAGANFGTGDGVVTVIDPQDPGKPQDSDKPQDSSKPQAPRQRFRIAEVVAGQGDVPMRNGQVVVVEAAPLVYVSGEVGHAGVFPLEAGMRVEQALALAGGVTARGSIGRLRITRRSDDGSTIDLPHPDRNTALEAGDVVFVKTRIF
jgi:polysaccharide export outer membrane protein